jgi:superfamily I DNA/RNA helicase
MNKYNSRPGLKEVDVGARKVAPTYGREAFVTFVEKGAGTLVFENDAERLVAHMLGFDPRVRRIEAQPFAVDLVDTRGLTAKQLLRESNSVLLAEIDGLQYLRLYFDALMACLGIDWRSHRLLSEHHQAFFDSSAARIEKLRREGAPYIGEIDFFRKVFQHRSGITVNTIHGVKGAEFDVVIAFGLLQGMVPNFNEEEDADRGAASAKKLLYVVGSRARKHLHLISEQQRRRGGGRGPYPATEALAGYAFDYDVV